MAYNTKEIVKDKDGNPISQYYNPSLDKYEPVEGASGGNKVVLYNEDGTENNSLSLIPILDKLSQLTGTVVDEETRKSNELQRIALYDNIENLLNTGQLKGDKGDTGNGLQFNWSGTQLGIRVEGQPSYTYVDLKGEKGDKGEKGETGDISSLNKSHVETALGYTINASVPTNAKFTDTTYSEITTAEIDLGTASTLRTITARRLKYLLDKIVALFPTKVSELTNDSGFLTSVTKSDVGLGDVTNDKQMPISGGILENYREKLTALSGTTTTINLSSGNVFTHALSGNTTYSITNAVDTQAHSFTLIITQSATARTITFPASVKWQGGEIPDLTTSSKTYVLTFMTVNGGTTWLGMFGGEF